MFKKGNEELLGPEYKRIGVIGSRDSTAYDRMRTIGLVADLIDYDNVVIVSGLAHGIDTMAHMSALHHTRDGRTIAVVHNMVKIYPKENIKLSKEIVKNGGLIISPYGTFDDDYKVGKLAFLDRDRMLVDICHELVVIGDYNHFSGTAYTVNYAEQKGLKISKYK